MKSYYEVSFTLSDGSELNELSVADTPSRAIAILFQHPRFQKKLAGRTITDFKIEEAYWAYCINKDEFSVHESEDGQHWIVIDVKKNVTYKIKKNNGQDQQIQIDLVFNNNKELLENEDLRRRHFRKLLVWISRYRNDLGRTPF